MRTRSCETRGFPGTTRTPNKSPGLTLKDELRCNSVLPLLLATALETLQATFNCQMLLFESGGDKTTPESLLMTRYVPQFQQTRNLSSLLLSEQLSQLI
jgi:hypothetical protein